MFLGRFVYILFFYFLYVSFEILEFFEGLNLNEEEYSTYLDVEFVSEYIIWFDLFNIVFLKWNKKMYFFFVDYIYWIIVLMNYFYFSENYVDFYCLWNVKVI